MKASQQQRTMTAYPRLRQRYRNARSLWLVSFDSNTTARALDEGSGDGEPKTAAMRQFS